MLRVRKVAEARLPTRFGSFRILGLEDRNRGEAAVVLLKGNLARARAPLVRIHSQCLTGDVFGSLRCDCRAQLEMAMNQVSRARAGVILYQPQEGRGIGLMNKLMAYELQDRGMDTVEANRKLGFAADHRSYEFSAAVLKFLKLKTIRLLSNNPGKVAGLEAAGIRVVERVPCEATLSRRARKYLRTKKEKLGHLISRL